MLMLATVVSDQYTSSMSIELDDQAFWGQRSFDYDLSWESELDARLDTLGLAPNEVRQRATREPTFDVFDLAMPTNRAKHDIGRYVLGSGFDVPLVDSMKQWQEAILAGQAMLRSDAARDYTGMGGLLSSRVIQIQPDVGIPEAEPHRPTLDPVPNIHPPFEGTLEKVPRDKDDIQALLLGDRDPADIMFERWWRQEQAILREEASKCGIFTPNLHLASTYASRWRYIPGVNVRVFRDPIVEGKYYMGGNEAHHEWTVTDGQDSADVEAHTKSGYRRGETPETFQYSLPTGKIIEFYEQVRNLPFFDQTQAPVMEMQLDDDGTLYFLQYLKTGKTIADIEEFPLPEGRNVIFCEQVRGATSPRGEKVRIYLDPPVFTRAMHEAGVQVSFNMTMDPTSLLLQTAAMNSRIVITDHNLTFKDNHSNSSPLFRPPVAIGMWDGVGDVGQKFTQLNEEQPFHYAGDVIDKVEYVDATVTSNGRRATIESDWEIKSQSL